MKSPYERILSITFILASNYTEEQILGLFTSANYSFGALCLKEGNPVIISCPIDTVQQLSQQLCPILDTDNFIPISKGNEQT
jgi:hypothetical protein